LGIAIICLFQNCNLQKRKYQKGFYVSTKKHSSSPKNLRKPDADSEIKTIDTELSEPVYDLSATTLNYPIVEHPKTNKLNLFKIKDSIPISCKDTIILVNSLKIIARDIIINDEIISYKKCDNTEDTYEISKTSVASVVLANGSTDIFNIIIEEKVEPPLTKSQKRRFRLLGFLLFLGGLVLIAIGCLVFVVTFDYAGWYLGCIIIGFGIPAIIVGLSTLFEKN